MKKTRKLNLLFISIFILIVLSFKKDGEDWMIAANGAYQAMENGNTELLLIADGHFMLTTYNKENKKFIRTEGGAIKEEANHLKGVSNFSSAGELRKFSFAISGTSLTLDENGKQTSFKQVDNGQAALTGCWRISSRKQGDEMVPMPLAARRTLKLLTGKHFQWAAINVETGEFFGTGGGTYQFQNGNYTENIEFFSRVSSRVGASLSFEGNLKDGQWHHSGRSSRGEPIYEIWTKF